MANIERILLLDSMRPGLYVFSRSMYNLLSHTRDLALSTIAKSLDTLSSPLIALVREDPSHDITAAPERCGWLS